MQSKIGVILFALVVLLGASRAQAATEATVNVGADVGPQIMLNVSGLVSALQFTVSNSELKSAFAGNTAQYFIDSANDPSGLSVQSNSNNPYGFRLVVYCSDDMRSVASPSKFIPINQLLFTSVHGGQSQAPLSKSETTIFTQNSPGTVNDTMTFFSKIFSRDAALPDYQTTIYFVLKNL